VDGAKEGATTVLARLQAGLDDIAAGRKPEGLARSAWAATVLGALQAAGPDELAELAPHAIGLAQRLRALGLRELARAVAQVAAHEAGSDEAQAAAGDPQQLPQPDLALPGEGEWEGVHEPDGWRLTARGVYRLIEERGLDGEVTARWVRALDVPLAVVAVRRGLEAGPEDEELGLRWRGTDGVVRAGWVRPEQAYDSAQVVKALARCGVRVDSSERKAAARWLRECTQAQEMAAGKLRREVVARRLGWHDLPGGQRALVLADAVVPGEEEAAPVRPALPGGSQALAEALRPAGDGAVQARELAAVARQAPILAALVGASVASILGRVVRREPAVVHVWGTSSTGKTTALRAAASVWGDPRGIIRDWDATRRGVQARAEMLADLPLVLDELSVAGRAEEYVYAHVSGVSRGRARRDGSLAHEGRWWCWLLSTGEEPLGAGSSRSGARARVLDLDATEGVVPDAAAARRVQAVTDEHHGHLGRAVLRAWPGDDEVRALYAELVAAAHEHLSGIEARTAEASALVVLGLHLLEEATGEDWGRMAVAELLGGIMVGRQTEADVALHALGALRDYLAAHPDRIAGSSAEMQATRDLPRDGWLGWQSGDGAIDFLPEQLDALLEQRWGTPGRRGRARAIRREWAARGWLATKGNRTTVLARVGGRVQRVVRLLPEAWAALDAEG